MAIISEDGKCVDLWGLLTNQPVILDGEECSQSVREEVEENIELGQKVKQLLNRTARVYGQELRLHVDDDGWRIEVFSCEDETGESELTLVIPKDRKKPVRVLTRQDPVEVVVPEKKAMVTP